MIVLAAVLLVLAVTLGAATLTVLWPLAVVAAAALFCLDRPARRTAWPVVAVLLLAAGVGYRLADPDVHLAAGGTTLVVLAPFVVAALLVLAAGGPSRIRARHERADVI